MAFERFSPFPKQNFFPVESHNNKNRFVSVNRLMRKIYSSLLLHFLYCNYSALFEKSSCSVKNRLRKSRYSLDMIADPDNIYPAVGLGSLHGQQW